jgi:cytochrome c biogenesis protein CcdA
MTKSFVMSAKNNGAYIENDLNRYMNTYNMGFSIPFFHLSFLIRMAENRSDKEYLSSLRANNISISYKK